MQERGRRRRREDVVDAYKCHDAEETDQDDESRTGKEESAGRVDVSDRFEAKFSGLRHQGIDAAGADNTAPRTKQATVRMRTA